MLGATLEHVLLIGIVGASFDPGLPLTDAVREAAAEAIRAILEDLQGLGLEAREVAAPARPQIWWTKPASA
jgi:hypothetical protein